MNKLLQKLSLAAMLSMSANFAFAAEAMIGQNLVGSQDRMSLQYQLAFENNSGGIQLELPPREEVKVPFPISLGFRNRQHAQLNLCIVAGAEAQGLTLSMGSETGQDAFRVMFEGKRLGQTPMKLAKNQDCHEDNVQLSIFKDSHTSLASNETITLIVSPQ